LTEINNGEKFIELNLRILNSFEVAFGEP